VLKNIRNIPLHKATATRIVSISKSYIHLNRNRKPGWTFWATFTRHFDRSGKWVYNAGLL